jgi:hypothetical protein
LVSISQSNDHCTRSFKESSDSAMLHLLSHLFQFLLQLFDLLFQLLMGVTSQSLQETLLLVLGLSGVVYLVDAELLPGHPVKGLTERLFMSVSLDVTSLEHC